MNVRNPIISPAMSIISLLFIIESPAMSTGELLALSLHQNFCLELRERILWPLVIQPVVHACTFLYRFLPGFEGCIYVCDATSATGLSRCLHQTSSLSRQLFSSNLSIFSKTPSTLRHFLLFLIVSVLLIDAYHLLGRL